jgi:hypothetical protein
MDSTAYLQVMAERLRMIVVVEWLSIAVFVVFVVAMARIGLSAWGGIRDLRSRRLKPIWTEGKSLGGSGLALARSMITHGKRLADITTHTVSNLGLRARTTASLVKGTIPGTRTAARFIGQAATEARSAMTTVDALASAVKSGTPGK